MISLTHKQSELLGFIKHYQEENPDVSPSFEEMKDACQLKSKSGVHRLISALEERGYIERIPNRARCIKVKKKNAPDVLSTFSSAELLAEITRRHEANKRGKNA